MLARTLLRPSLRASPTYSRWLLGSVSSLARRTRVARDLLDEEVRQFMKQKVRQAEAPFPNAYGSSNTQHETYSPPFGRGSMGSMSVPNPNGIITPQDPIYDILSEPTLVIERQLEVMNVVLGFEQANKYKILNAQGQQVGFMEEVDFGLLKVLGRQFFRTHRPFDINVYNNYGDLVLVIKRPFSFINSHIKAFLPGLDNYGELMFEEIGESVQSWHLWRRRYNLFKLEDENHQDFNQFGAIDSPFLSFDFPVYNDNGAVIGGVDRNWVGLGRELFTDTGVYIVRMDPLSFHGMEGIFPDIAGPMTLDQRAILLGTAVSIDFDYFSRHSRPGGGFLSFGSYE
ncbi:uncharacterized protein KQ657_003173 [Scheffersomyces spartinae]|uniref:Phospholipid scramblase n=1 Tax=Scheffersomyces spartinae TaxID=45513 RepID=A0A9P7VCA2_9ASCO|nr:uncharacterized protein KQ657_003173 [Scheffersomyces spartinae]KAG7195415.1 hypothetical protein KQ657_003173 [Scheffersomyces spartinae]